MSDPFSKSDSPAQTDTSAEDVPLMFLVVNGDNRVMRVSEAALAALSQPRKALIGRSLQELGLDPQSTAPALEEFADLSLKWVSIRARHELTDASDNQAVTLYLLAPRRDLGERLEKLQQENQRLISCLEGTGVGTWQWNLATGNASYDSRWADILGFTPEELAPHSLSTWQRRAHPKDLKQARAALTAHLNGETPCFEIEMRLRHKDEHWVWVHVRGRAFPTAPGDTDPTLFGTLTCLEENRELFRKAERSELLMSRTGRAAGVGGWELDLETNELIWTEETRRIHGVPADFVPSVDTAIDFYAPEARPLIAEAVETALADGTPWDLELPFIRHTGERIWVRALGEVEYRDGIAVSLFGAFLDITERVERTRELAQARQEAQETRARLWSAIEALPEAFVLYDREDRAVMFNSKYLNIYAESAEAIRRGEQFETILRAGLDNQQYPEAIGREDDWLAERMERHRNPKGPIEQVLPGDRYLQIHEVRLENGDTVGFRIDVTQLKRQQRELADKAYALEVAATTDPLTGLSNRRGLETVMARIGHMGEAGETYGVLHLDLDRFKPINDVFGHAAGDHLLCRVAEILRHNVRTGDHVARVGGDEFVVVLKSPVTEARAAKIASRIIAHCNQPVMWEDKTLHFGASIGIALGPPAEMTAMLHNADIALYEAKKSGRNCHHFFTAELRNWVETRKTLSDDLLMGMKRGEVIAHYQPQYSATDGRLVGIEALARWDHPTRGTLSPAVFLELAEEMGILAEVDRLIFEHALETGRLLAEGGQGLEKVSVNVSLSRLTQSQNMEWLPSTEDLPFQLCLEILEAVDVDRDFDEISWAFDGLRERGIQVEVDDFGSGRASLTSLLKIRPDRIKLDTEIVRAAAFDPVGAGSMVRAIAEMCAGLGIPMTAEGIETQEHAALMTTLGCDLLQGYFFAHPMSRADLMALRSDPGALRRPAG